jgi:hypothetical protein
MMDEKLDWTTELGQAFIAQPDDVFNSIQRLRAKAQGVENLKDTPQQVIVVEKEIIKIMPANPQIIYVPQYQPQVLALTLSDMSRGKLISKNSSVDLLYEGQEMSRSSSRATESPGSFQY